jgi:hypothetical protein
VSLKAYADELTGKISGINIFSSEYIIEMMTEEEDMLLVTMCKYPTSFDEILY